MNKPPAKIIGANGNVFNLLAICMRSLKGASMKDKAEEMKNRVTSSKSYDDALAIMMEYIEPVSV